MMQKKSTIITTISLTGLAYLAGVFLSGSLVFADDDSAIDQIDITVPVACTLSSTGQDSHNANISNGTYQSDIGTTTLRAFCNDNEGFAIYAIGYTDNEEGKNVLTNSTLGSAHDIITGTNTSGNASNWAMKLAKITTPTPIYPIIIAGSIEDSLKEQNDPDFSTFQEVPDDYTKVAYRIAATDIGTNAQGSVLTTSYQAYISQTQSAGTYTGRVKYTLIHPYDAEKPEKTPTSIDTATTLQDASVCADNLTVGQAYTLVDSRDGEQYKVAKLADSNCWILDNLRLDPTTANLNSSNTNASAAAIDNYLNGGSTIEGWSNVAVYIEPYFFESYTEPMINNEYENDIVTSFGDSSGKNGIYYNYCAATVGTICYDENYQGTMPSEASYDICPLHWHLPSDDQYSLLVETYPDTGSLQQAMGVSLSGLYFYNYLEESNERSSLNAWGYYWGKGLSTRGSATSLPVDSYSNDYYGTHFRYSGDTIRCVLDSPDF